MEPASNFASSSHHFFDTDSRHADLVALQFSAVATIRRGWLIFIIFIAYVYGSIIIRLEVPFSHILTGEIVANE
jgi:hypothetical protein